MLQCDDNKIQIHEVGDNYPRHLYDLQSDLPFFSEQMKIKKHRKFVYNLFNKEKMLSSLQYLKIYYRVIAR